MKKRKKIKKKIYFFCNSEIRPICILKNKINKICCLICPKIKECIKFQKENENKILPCSKEDIKEEYCDYML